MTGCNRKSLISRNKQFVLFLSQLCPRDRRKIIEVVGGQHINTISEIFQNFLKKNLTHDLKEIKKLKRYSQEVRQVAFR